MNLLEISWNGVIFKSNPTDYKKKFNQFFVWALVLSVSNLRVEEKRSTKWLYLQYLTVHSAERPLQCSGFSKFERFEKMYTHVLFDLRQNDDSRVQRAQVESRAGDSDLSR